MEKPNKQPLIVLLGPTSSGKTRLAAKLALKFNGEIVSADSRQVYRDLNLGAGKDLSEYQILGKKIPYHLIDIVSPVKNFSVFQYQKKAFSAIRKINKKGRLPFLVGGSGLYLKTVIEATPLSSAGPDLKLRQKVEQMEKEERIVLLKKLNQKLPSNFDWHNPRRVTRAIEIALANKKQKTTVSAYPCHDSLVLGIKNPIAETRKRIKERLETRLKEGLLAEVENLLKNGVSHERLRELGMECRYLSYYLSGEMNYQEAILRLNFAIGRFAKRQLTWFGKTPNVIWIKSQKEAESLIKKHLKKFRPTNSHSFYSKK
jgi:tRNA dimethylallyltransferase